ncbi:MAG: arsenate reductase [Proteobacteria bacterium]|nr:MAG: arsenate reductase [Pseudomonadota bacterium]
MTNVQIFGIKNSSASRAAERFFKERRMAIQFVDLKQKPMSPGEIRRFIERFGLDRLLDTESSAYVDAGLKYMKMSDAELLERVSRTPALLRLPLVRFGNQLAVGQDEAGWKGMVGK